MASLEQQLLGIQKKLQQKIKQSMMNEVSRASHQTMRDEIIMEVYNKYTSNAEEPYQRRYDQGGLIDDHNIQTKMIDNNTLKVENITTDYQTGRNIVGVIESGTGYTWKNSEIYHMQPFPRSFVERTFEILKSGVAVSALRKGLQRQGINCK